MRREIATASATVSAAATANNAPDLERLRQELRAEVAAEMTGLRAELGVVTKKDASGKPYGVRPTITYAAGPLTLRAGVESVKTEGSTAAAQTGVGLSAGYAINDSTYVNVNFAKNSKANAQSFGANATFGAAGVGLVQDKNGSAKQTTVYAAYSFPLFGIKGATITPAISRSTGTGKDGVTALRVRLNYAF